MRASASATAGRRPLQPLLAIADLLEQVPRQLRVPGNRDHVVGIELRVLEHERVQRAVAQDRVALVARAVITVRDSSLSACAQAIAAARCDHLRLAFDYAAEAALIDLRDVEHNVADGLHLAALAGAWLAFVFGFGGMRARGGTLAFTPKLPEGLTRYAFSVTHRGRCLHVDVTRARAEYTLRSPGAVKIAHHGEAFDLTDAAPVSRPLPAIPPREPPTQPPGRAPRRRSPG